MVFGAIVASNPNPAFVLNLAHPPLPSNPSPPPYPLDHSICITAASSSAGPPALGGLDGDGCGTGLGDGDSGGGDGEGGEGSGGGDDKSFSAGSDGCGGGLGDGRGRGGGGGDGGGCGGDRWHHPQLSRQMLSHFGDLQLAIFWVLVPTSAWQ